MTNWIAHTLDPLRELTELKDVPRITGRAAGPLKVTEPVTEPRPGREPDELGASPMLPLNTESARGGRVPVTGSMHPFARGIAEQSRIVTNAPPPKSCAPAWLAKVLPASANPAATAAGSTDLRQSRTRSTAPRNFERMRFSLTVIEVPNIPGVDVDRGQRKKHACFPARGEGHRSQGVVCSVRTRAPTAGPAL